MEIVGYFSALLIGFALAVFGAGGSILTIPILIYLFGYAPLPATTYAFIIVGFTAAIGTLQNIRQRNVYLRPAIFFAFPSVLSIFLVRNVILPNIPEQVGHIGNITLTKDLIVLAVFSVIMAVAGFKMIRSRHGEDAPQGDGGMHPFMLMLLGAMVGFVLGFAGVGGGFLITPALVMFAKLPIRRAIGTSLLIISLNSFVGFFSSLQMHADIDWAFIAIFIALTALGIFLGNLLSGRIRSSQLQGAFGWFLFAFGIFMIVSEIMDL
ncbi:MAG: sulfite exporter TauE/SafE family protein [Chitinophagales bacterium]